MLQTTGKDKTEKQAWCNDQRNDRVKENMIRIKIKLPAIKEFYAEFTDELHMDQFRKFFVLSHPGSVTMNGVSLRPKITIKEILEPEPEINV